MGKATQKKVEVMISFLKNFRIFQKMSESTLQQLNYYMKEQKFINRGSVLFKQGQRCEGLFLIKSGSFEVIKNLEYSTILLRKSLGQKD